MPRSAIVSKDAAMRSLAKCVHCRSSEKLEERIIDAIILQKGIAAWWVVEMIWHECINSTLACLRHGRALLQLPALSSYAAKDFLRVFFCIGRRGLLFIAKLFSVQKERRLDNEYALRLYCCCYHPDCRMRGSWADRASIPQHVIHTACLFGRSSKQLNNRGGTVTVLVGNGTNTL